jgi:hypothetical protein
MDSGSLPKSQGLSLTKEPTLSRKPSRQSTLNDGSTVPRKTKWVSMGTELSDDNTTAIEESLEYKPPVETSPMIRNKSSFSFDYNAYNFSPIVKQSTLGDRTFTSDVQLTADPGPSFSLDSPSQETVVSVEGAALIANSFFNSELPQKRELISTEEGILKALEMRYFTGIWSHNISKIYYLMFLVYHKRENIYVNLFLI